MCEHTFGTGAKTSHCASPGGCCRTFSTPHNFDKHRRNGQCLDPAAVGLVSSQRPWGTVWHAPSRED